MDRIGDQPLNSHERSPRAAVLPTLVGVALMLALVGLALRATSGDATVFIGFGIDSEPTLEYAEAELGEFARRIGQGHDGKFFFVQANDPLLLAPQGNAKILDYPAYRSQRMLYPLLAGVFGLLGSTGVVWGLLIVNVVAFAWGTYVTSRLAQEIGGSPWWGLAFSLNLGFVFTMTSSLSDVLAGALVLAAVLAAYRRQGVASISLLVAATLSREVMLLTAFGLAVYYFLASERRRALWTALVPGAAYAGWLGYVSWRLGPDPEAVPALSLPFVGLFSAMSDWLGRPATLLTGLGTITLLVFLAIRWWSSRSLLAWAFIGFVPMAMVISDRVWTNAYDFTRAVAPALTAAVLLVFAERRSSIRHDAVAPAYGVSR